MTPGISTGHPDQLGTATAWRPQKVYQTPGMPMTNKNNIKITGLRPHVSFRESDIRRLLHIYYTHSGTYIYT